MKFCMSCMSQYEDGYDICPHCGFQEGTLPADSRCMEPGSILADRYIVGMPIALDSWTIRYIGWDALTEQKVTVNEFFPTRYAVREMGKTELTVVRQEPFYQYMSALLRRARLLAETRLPEAICPVHESFEKNGTAYVITACIEGQPFSDFLAERAPVNEPEAEKLMLPVLRALDKLHENGFIAGGFSPDDLVVDENGRLVLRDFIPNCFFHVTDNPDDIKAAPYDDYYPCERIEPSEKIRLAPENDVYSAAMVFYALLGAMLPEGKLRAHTYAQKHRDILKKPSAFGAKMSKSKENALINAAAPAIPVRTSDMETFIKELTSDRQVPIKAQVGKGFPLWAKIAIPAAAAVLIAAAILLIPMLFAKGKEELPLDDRTVVPNIVSMRTDKAEQELQKAGLLLEIEGKTIDDSVEEELVLTQSVEEGAMVGVNTPVGVTVSAHSAEFSMPNFVGMPLEGCTDTLSQLGINYSTDSEFSESVAEGCVTAQSVTPFTTVKAGTPLTLTVSKGPDPDKAEDVSGGYGSEGGYGSGAPAEVSDYSDRPYEEVIEQAAEDHTPIEVEERVVDDSLPEGTVLSQTPAAGEEREPDEPVKVVLSTAGSTIIMPDLTLMNKDIVTYILKWYGMTPEFTEEYSDTVAEGLVTEHDPAEDAEVESGTVVKVTLSKGRELVTMPDLSGCEEKEAAARLKEAGIAFTLIYDTDIAKPDGTVIGQSLAAGTEVPKGTSAVITVNAAGGVARVPAIVGMELDEADRLVKNAGLNLLIFVDRDHPFSEGQVYAQGPKAGLFLEKGGDVVVFLTGKQESASGAPSLTISPKTADIAVGEEFTLTVSAVGIDDLSMVNYDISDMTVVDVFKIDRKTLTMTFRGLSSGTAEITISCGKLRQTCAVTVK